VPTRLHMPLRAIAALTVVTVALMAGCGGSSDDSSGSSAATSAAKPAAAGGAQKVDIASFKYAPASITVKAGSSITFTNRDNAEHTATSDMAGAFDTGTLRKGATKSVRLPAPGTYAYHCDFHPFMHGTVVVQ
jgi:plastocyanin